jgi:transcriptional regulator with XRE-family HTH domain
MECNDLLKLLGNRIRALRKAKDISQERLAELASLHPVFISNVETGKVKASICSYHSIAEALEKSLAELVELPGEGESWDSDMIALFQSAKKLNKDKQIAFVKTVKGVLNGLEGL